MTSLEVCTKDMLADIMKNIPLMSSRLSQMLQNSDTELTNIQLYRMYIELYLRGNENVNQSLDLIVTQKEATAYGVPIYVYFFTKDKEWASYERKQSDIFDHLMTIVPEFGLRLYQRP